MPFKNTGTLLLSLEGEIAFASTYFCALVGISHTEVVGMSWFDFVFTEDMDAALELFEASKLPHANPLRFRVRRLDGTQVWTDIQAGTLPAWGQAREVLGVVATVIGADGNR